MVVKSDGSIWFTDPHYGIRTNYEGFKSDQELPCNVYRTDPATLEPAGPGEVIHELRIAEDVETLARTAIRWLGARRQGADDRGARGDGACAAPGRTGGAR